MSSSNKIISWLGGWPRRFDVWINSKPLAWLHKKGVDPISPYDGEEGKTISDGMGLIELEAICQEYQKHHDLVNPGIPLKYPLGQFLDALCSLVQDALTGKKVDHGLDSIDWESEGAKKLLQKFPDARIVLAKYIKAQGLQQTA